MRTALIRGRGEPHPNSNSALSASHSVMYHQTRVWVSKFIHIWTNNNDVFNRPLPFRNHPIALPQPRNKKDSATARPRHGERKCSNVHASIFAVLADPTPNVYCCETEI
jgi:hypothetical protein